MQIESTLLSRFCLRAKEMKLVMEDSLSRRMSDRYKSDRLTRLMVPTLVPRFTSSMFNFAHQSRCLRVFYPTLPRLLYFRFIFPYSPGMTFFPTGRGLQALLVTCKDCRRDIPAKVTQPPTSYIPVNAAQKYLHPSLKGVAEVVKERNRGWMKGVRA